MSLKLANRAEATITKYRSILEIFLSECTLPIEQLNSESVLKWIQSYSVSKKEKTMILVVSILSSFFKFCLAEDYMESTIIKKRWRPKLPNALPKYLSEQEYARVKMAAENFSLRDRAVIFLLFSSGCRRSEVAQLTLNDVDLNKGTAIVKGKGKKIRNIHFNEECALVLRDYLKTRSCDKNGPLFMNRFGQPLQQNGIYKITTKLGKVAGLEKTLHPHVCRHTFATNMLSRGAELQLIADEMGHTNLNTTRVYARIPSEDLITAYRNKME